MEGIFGKDLKTEKGEESAILATLNALAAIQSAGVSLDQISQIVKIGVFVASTSDFREQHLVANFASNLLLEIFGEKGKHARFAIGTSSLPLNAPLEIEMIAATE